MNLVVDIFVFNN